MNIKKALRTTTCNIFKVAKFNEKATLWDLKSTNMELIPEDENLYVVRGLLSLKGKIKECLIDITTPERISENLFFLNFFGQLIHIDNYSTEFNAIPKIASNCFGDYELYYFKDNPEIGIEILKKGLLNSLSNNVVSEDLGYILRDIDRTQDAIQAFKISEDRGPSSEFIYLELSQLYYKIGLKEKAEEYKNKYIANGGFME